MINPLVSVVMPVYNTGKYLYESIRSILLQSFIDFEFIIINDGSTDDSLDIIRSFNDKRIKIVNNVKNTGNYSARNKGNSLVLGKYICVMDSDDVSSSQRLEKQVNYMEKNPDVGISGGGFRYYGSKDTIFREIDYENLKVTLLRNNCFYHPTLILRKDLLRKYNLQYNEKYYLAADYDLLVRGARHFPITNIAEDLFHYRIHGQQNSLNFHSMQTTYSNEIKIQQIKFLGIEPNYYQIKLHLSLLMGTELAFKEEKKVLNWLENIKKANNRIKYYDSEKLETFLNALMTKQPFLYQESDRNLFKEIDIKEKEKIDLRDVTFILIFRIYSQEQINNINSIIKYLSYNFQTSIRIFEIHHIKKFVLDDDITMVKYQFIKDRNKFLNRNHWLNKIINSVGTPYFAIWDADSIVQIKQIVETVDNLRSANFIMSFPHDGRLYNCDRMTSNLFRSTLDADILQKHILVFRLIESIHSVGGIFFANTTKYLSIGSENETIFNQVIEDIERVKRIEMADKLVFHAKGPLFILWHQEMIRKLFDSPENRMNDRLEFLRTCSITH